MHLGSSLWVFSSKSAERQQAVHRMGEDPRTQVLLEAPHRIEALATALATLGERQVSIGRELTKQFEEIATLPAQELSAWLGANSQRLKGEFALVLHARAVVSTTGQDQDRVLRVLLAELPLKTAVKLAAELTGEGRNALYERALFLKNTT